MKSFLLILITVFLCACGTQKVSKNSKMSDAEWDNFSDEAYLRWGDEQLKTVTDVPLVKCYQDDVKEGLEEYRKKFSIENKDPYYWLHIANCYFKAEKFNKAEFFYQLTLDNAKTKKTKSMALNNLSLLKFKWGQWEKGRDALKEAISLAPDFKIPKYNLAQLYIQFGLYDSAIGLLNHKAFKNKKDIDVYHSLANAHLFKGELEAANKYFGMIPTQYFKRSDIAATYALYLIKSGNIKKAKEILASRETSKSQIVSARIQKIEQYLKKNRK